MASKTVPIGQFWVVEIVGGVPHHAEALHHATGATIVGNGERDDLGQVESVEPKSCGCVRALSRVPAAPVLHRKAPANLDARRKVGREARSGQTNESGERRDAGNFHCPQSKTVLLEVVLDARRQSIAFLPRQDTRKELHDSRIGVQSRKGAAVTRTPTAQVKPVRSKFARHVHHNIFGCRARHSGARPLC